MYQTVKTFLYRVKKIHAYLITPPVARLEISDPCSVMNQKEYDVIGEIAMLTRDASHPSAVRMCMVITRALLIGQRRGLLIKTQARACYPSELLSHLRQDRD